MEALDRRSDVVSRARGWASAALDLLFPFRCVVCRREGAYLCDDCAEGLPRLRPPYCRICANPGEPSPCGWCAAHAPAIEGITAPYLMEGPVREMVHDLKYRNIRASAPVLARLLWLHLRGRPLAADLVVPVPLHPRRLRHRGYNQSGLLASELGPLLGIPVDPGALRKVRDTAPQVSLSTDERRRAALLGAFDAPRRLDGLRVLLVDDVATTGSTLFSGAAALRTAGAASVLGVVLARQA